MNAFSLLLWLHIFIIIVIIISTIMECVFKIVSIHLFYDTQTVDRLYFFGGPIAYESRSFTVSMALNNLGGIAV